MKFNAILKRTQKLYPYIAIKRKARYVNLAGGQVPSSTVLSSGEKTLFCR